MAYDKTRDSIIKFLLESNKPISNLDLNKNFNISLNHGTHVLNELHEMNYANKFRISKRFYFTKVDLSE